ncbi:transketolase-like TK C-terminal-containing protein [Acetobacter nitrogenifigens]|uniref:Transketolase n=1 Tax=Acetobacter nitrogenifigens DSM 23921 = NBRC 105050 TaxID=1120919 RepID=A0A511X608_9PROT|nr:transketolase [Acetobacter nitrogenifigens]GEN58386.1 transketolase [Acetobacter nitrogenifigens DSM 23921 = NBRC 105050]
MISADFSSGAGRDFRSAIRFARAARAQSSGETGISFGHSGVNALYLVVAILWERFLRFDPSAPAWADSDRFFVSSMRLSPLLHAFLRLTGAPEHNVAAHHGNGYAIGMTAGLAGQGVAAAVGMSLTEKMLAARFGQSLVDHRTWLLATPADLDAGVALEASAIAGRFRLDRLTVIVGDAFTRSSTHDLNLAIDRIEASGWAVRRVAANDANALGAALASCQRSRRPSLLVCDGDDDGTQVSIVDDGEYELVGPWSVTARRGRVARHTWLRRLARHRLRAEFERTTESRAMPRLIDDWRRAWATVEHTPSVEAYHVEDERAARSIVRDGLRGRDILTMLLPEFVSMSAGGDSSRHVGKDSRSPAASTTSSGRRRSKAAHTNSDISTTPLVVPGEPLFFGAREPAMVGLMNGLSQHGGALACGVATLSMVDRIRPALRFAALAGRRMLCLLVEDDPQTAADLWPTVEELASLRAMPNLALFRPGDRQEVIAAWEMALEWRDGPAVIVLGLSPATKGDSEGSMTDDPHGDAPPPASLMTFAAAHGGYVRAEAPGGPMARQATIIASGPELAIAREAQVLLMRDDVRVAVVSLPCWELFARQDSAYRAAVLGSAPRVAIEAASGFGWERWLGFEGVFIGRNDFVSSPGQKTLYGNFGITPEGVRDRVRQLLGSRVSESRIPGLQSDGAAMTERTSGAHRAGTSNHRTDPRHTVKRDASPRRIVTGQSEKDGDSSDGN